ncbi:hypothetical protein Clole_1810 [Cellulosilyticum lentocellum DSM 5427]|uniref:Uncharacterized protein n=1 Tax=Cellulosilyticum lentocellum (strain ATCC 49066 / DSM 5427 / NCIMB 11756 / RHM5) TaxID=642492 RepID=F2JN79_CELLD|nr:hypothetical protein Clole_1810 [Cellulosilyticum lentocellum DSM 5427]
MIYPSIAFTRPTTQALEIAKQTTLLSGLETLVFTNFI